MDGAGWYRFGMLASGRYLRYSKGIQDAVKRAINVIIFLIVYNKATVINTRTPSKVHRGEVISPVLQGRMTDAISSR
jgi:hypothetical protein